MAFWDSPTFKVIKQGVDIWNPNYWVNRGADTIVPGSGKFGLTPTDPFGPVRESSKAISAMYPTPQTPGTPEMPKSDPNAYGGPSEQADASKIQANRRKAKKLSTLLTSGQGANYMSGGKKTLLGQ